MGMTINTDKSKVMIIKSKNINHGNYVYDNNFLEYVSYYKYLGINFHHQLNWNYRIEKRINWGSKAYYELENNCKLINIYIWSKTMLLFETLVGLIVLYGCEV